MSQAKTYTTAEIRYGTQGGTFVAIADHERQVTALREERDSFQRVGITTLEKLKAAEQLLAEVLPALDMAASAFKSAKPLRNKVRAFLNTANSEASV